MKKSKFISYLEEILVLWDNPVENRIRLEEIKQALYGNTRIYKVLENDASVMKRCNVLLEDINNKIVRATFAPRVLNIGPEPIDCVQNIVTLCNHMSGNIAIVQAYRLAEEVGVLGNWSNISRNTRIQDIDTAINHIENPHKDKYLGSVSKRVSRLHLRCKDIEQLFELTGPANEKEKEAINQFIERLNLLRHRGIADCIKILHQVIGLNDHAPKSSIKKLISL